MLFTHIKRLKRGLCLFFLVSILSLVSCSSEPAKKPWTIDELKSTIQPGDILLKHGHGIISRTISKTLQEPIPLSHCASVVEVNKDSIILVHAISGRIAVQNGVQKIRFSSFMKDVAENSLHVVRPIGTKKDLQQVCNTLLNLAKREVPFDMDFNHKDTSALYCNELIAFAYEKHIGDPLFNTQTVGDNEIYSFNSILHSDKVEILVPKTLK